jgi:hypothetical protein
MRFSNRFSVQLRIGTLAVRRAIQERLLIWQFCRLRRPSVADTLLPASFRTLKRGADDRCASGAMEI